MDAKQSNDKPLIEISERLAALRNYSQLTQAELAEYLGVSRFSVVNWEAKPVEGKRNNTPPPRKLGALAEFYNVPIDLLTKKEPVSDEELRVAIQIDSYTNEKGQFLVPPHAQALEKAKKDRDLKGVRVLPQASYQSNVAASTVVADATVPKTRGALAQASERAEMERLFDEIIRKSEGANNPFLNQLATEVKTLRSKLATPNKSSEDEEDHRRVVDRKSLLGLGSETSGVFGAFFDDTDSPLHISLTSEQLRPYRAESHNFYAAMRYVLTNKYDIDPLAFESAIRWKKFRGKGWNQTSADFYYESPKSKELVLADFGFGFGLEPGGPDFVNANLLHDRIGHLLKLEKFLTKRARRKALIVYDMDDLQRKRRELIPHRGVDSDPSKWGEWTSADRTQDLLEVAKACGVALIVVNDPDEAAKRLKQICVEADNFTSLRSRAIPDPPDPN